MNENLVSNHGWFLVIFPPLLGRKSQRVFVTSLGHGCLTSVARDWNADEALVVAGSLPLAQTDQLFLSISSSEEAGYHSCRLEQEVFQEFELFMSCLCSSWVLYTLE